MGLTKTFKKFSKTFWVANTLELFERWAWYGFYMLFANYLTGSTDTGALGLSQGEKGIIMGVGTGILYFLPVITGALADKYGYKRNLAISFIIYAAAFIALPFVKTFTAVFAVYLILALGAALFKPIISSTIAKTTDSSTASIGFGIYYMMINIGAFVGPLVTLAFKNSSYFLVFYISAGIIMLNFFVLLFYKEPLREKVEESFSKAISRVFRNIGLVISDFKFLIFLLLVSAFWSMYYQLFFTLPVFITQWVDTSSLYNFFENTLPFVVDNYGHNGQMDAEFITNFDAMYIIVFQVVISTLVMKFKPLKAMMTGILVCTIGMSLTLATQDVMFILISLFIFAIGEMASSPKITEYIGRIAPADKMGIYMGCSFLPVFFGSTLGGLISGFVYGNMSDKLEIAKMEASKQSFNIREISNSFTANDFYAELANKLNMNNNELTTYLWENYQPAKIWYVIFAIGLFASIALFLYDRFLITKK
ncbi:MAG: MFS transporter [Marinifilaceae bacterium]|jgi:dipeptide/tripeptide permease|nr:MFS transporter [Marinifilaceae bacterium]